MKARLLKSILNNTGYTVNQDDECICVGSPLCHDLISVNKKSLKLKYAIDAFREGRGALSKGGNSELLFIWDKLQEMIESGEIKDIIDGNDDIENPLPVFTVEDGELVETWTDAYGWPNTTVQGIVMYDNTYFKTKEEAIQYGIEEYEAGLKMSDRRLEEISNDLKEHIERGAMYLRYIMHLKSLQTNSSEGVIN